MAKKAVVRLMDEERQQLFDLTRNSHADTRTKTRARILLMAHDGATDERIGQTLRVGSTTIRRVRKQFLEGGIAEVIGQRPRRGGSPNRPDDQQTPVVPLGDKDSPPAHSAPATPEGGAGDGGAESAPVNGVLPGPVCGTQWVGTIAANAERQWFTSGWPASWHVLWTVMSLSVRPSPGELLWQVATERSGPESVTYWIRVKNLTSVPLTVEGRYTILSTAAR